MRVRPGSVSVTRTVLLVAAVATLSPVGHCARRTVSLAFEGEASEIRDVWMPIRARYEKLNPGVTVDLWPNVLKEKLYVEIAAGKPPDLWAAGSYQAIDFGLQGLALDLGAMVKKDKKFSLASVHKTSVEAFKFRGKLYGLPAFYNTYAIWMNQTALEKAGLPMPARAWTWSDYELYCKKLTLDANGDKRPEQFGAAMPALLYLVYSMPWINSAGGTVVDDPANPQKIAFNDATKTAMEWLKKLYDMKLVTAAFYHDFQSGKAAMHPYFPQGQRMTAAIKKKFKYDVSYLPVGPKGSIGDLQSYGFMISKGARNPAEAWKLMTWLISEGIMNQNCIPSAERFRSEKLWPPQSVDAFNPDPFMDAGDTSLQTPKFPGYYLVTAPLDAAVQSYSNGKKGYEQAFGPAIKEAQAILTRVLKRYGK